MAWKQNLIGNLLAFLIIGSVILAIYCRMARKTLTEVILEVREAFSAPIEE